MSLYCKVCDAFSDLMSVDAIFSFSYKKSCNSGVHDNNQVSLLATKKAITHYFSEMYNSINEKSIIIVGEAGINGLEVQHTKQLYSRDPAQLVRDLQDD